MCKYCQDTEPALGTIDERAVLPRGGGGGGEKVSKSVKPVMQN